MLRTVRHLQPYPAMEELISLNWSSSFPTYCRSCSAFNVASINYFFNVSFSIVKEDS
jgi:hypothetical protein